MLFDELAKAGLCQSSVFTCFQNAWASQSLSPCTDSASTLRHVLRALGSPLVSYASSEIVFVPHKDFTLRERHRCVELDARVNPTPSHSTTNDLCCTAFFASVWGQAAVLPRRVHLFHDLITQVFLRSLQCGIVAMGVIGVFVYAHNHHRRNIDNPGNFGDSMKGRIHFMTAIIPAYAPRVPVNLLDKVYSLGGHLH